MKLKTAAVLTIKEAPRMTDKGRYQIAEWLRRQARSLIKDGRMYSEKRFTARYLYRSKA